MEKLLDTGSEASALVNKILSWDVKIYEQARKVLLDNHRIGTQPEAPPELRVRWIYVTGGVGFVAIWSVAFLLEYVASVDLGLRGSLPRLVALLLPPWVVGAVGIVTNLLLWWNPQKYADYRTEVDVIAFVERNASFFLIGSSAVFLFASFAIQSLGLQFPFRPLIFYETVSLVFLSLALLLYWIPSDDAIALARLRHLKTVPFIFAVSFFLAAFMIVATSALS